VNKGFEFLASAGLTDVGRRRKNNEDALLCLDPNGVFCVADGMGGVQGGAIASQAAVDALREVFTDSPDAAFALTAKASSRLIARALTAASQWIKNRADERGLAGSGSTAVVLAFDRITPTQALVLHAGDSRAYRCRDGKLVQLSADHSVAAAAGLSDDRELPAMFRGVITRAVGLASSVELEETETDVRPNDLFLLCSDGLTKMVPDKQLQKTLCQKGETQLDALARQLIQQALDAGGEDNVSVVLVRVAESLPAAPTQDAPPETLALEALPLVVPAAEDDGGAVPDFPDADHDAATSETGQTPLTPFSGNGQTPTALHGATPSTATVRIPAQSPGRPRSNAMLVVIAAVLAATVVGLFFYLRSCEKQQAAPVSDKTLQNAPEPQRRGTDSQSLEPEN